MMAAFKLTLYGEVDHFSVRQFAVVTDVAFEAWALASARWQEVNDEPFGFESAAKTPENYRRKRRVSLIIPFTEMSLEHIGKILVTGGSGFIGSHLVRRLVGDCEHVLISTSWLRERKGLWTILARVNTMILSDTRSGRGSLNS